MERQKAPKTASSNGQSREDRLKAALKSNMARRKAQARARSVQNVQDDEKNKTKE